MKLLNKAKILLIAVAILPLSILEANPGFSRQMDMGCMACHNQTMSQLNPFGRKFAASGFTMTSGNQSMIDGDTIKLGLPSALNAGVLLKARYLKTNPEFTDDPTRDDVGSDRGSLEVYKVSKLFFGGKIAENVGGIGNFSYDSFGAKIAFAYELGSGYAGVSGFMDNTFGPFSGMEYYNTGLYAPLKLFENRKGTNAAQATELGHGPATGIQAYYGGDELYLMAGAYIPATSQHEGLDTGTSAIGVGRIAYAPTIGEWMVMVGAYGLNGTASMSNQALDNTKPQPSSAYLLDIERKAYGIDMQVEGEIAGMSTVIAFNAVLHNETKLYRHDTGIYVENFDGLFTNGIDYKAGDNTAFSAEIQFNPWEPFGIKLAYLTYDDKFNYATNSKDDKWDRDDYSLGLDYSFRQNVRFAIEYTYSNPSRSDRPTSNDIFAYAMVGF